MGNEPDFLSTCGFSITNMGVEWSKMIKIWNSPIRIGDCGPDLTSNIGIQGKLHQEKTPQTNNR